MLQGMEVLQTVQVEQIQSNVSEARSKRMKKCSKERNLKESLPSFETQAIQMRNLRW